MGELVVIPEASWKNRLLIGGLASCGLYALVMWVFVYRRLPMRLDEEGMTLRDGTRFLWKDAGRVMKGEDLAISFGEMKVSILPSDLENGEEAVRYAEARLREIRGAGGRAKGASGPSLPPESEKKGKISGKVGSNLHFLTTFRHGMTRQEIGSRLGSDKGLAYDAEKNTLDQDTSLVPPFEHIKYAFEGDRLTEITLELTYSGDWPDFEDMLHDAMFSLQGVYDWKEIDGRPFTVERVRARLEEGAGKGAVGVMFAADHVEGTFTGVLRSRDRAMEQIYMFTMTFAPTPSKG